MPTEDRPSGRLPLIDLVRGVSILLVMAGHFGMARAVLSGGAALPGWNVLARNGPYGVALFFLISGFLITNILTTGSGPSVSTISLREFYGRRAARLLPLLAAVAALGTVIPLFFSSPSPIVRIAFARQVAPAGLYAAVFGFVFNWYAIAQSAQRQLPGLFWLIFWSLSIEEQFYLFYPLLMRAARTRAAALGVLSLFVLAGPLVRLRAVLAAPHSMEPALYNSFGAFDQIALGCILSFVRRMRPEPGRGLALALSGAGAAVMISTYVLLPLASPAGRIAGPLVLDFGLFALLLGGLALPWDRVPVLELACFPGERSYGMYLLHVGVLVTAWGALGALPLWAGFAGYLLLTIAAAAASYRWLERPLNRRIRELLIAAPAGR